MSTIDPFVRDARPTSAASSGRAAAASSADKTAASTRTAAGPAVKVKFSDRAKAVMARATSDRAVADRLEAQVAATRSQISGYGGAKAKSTSQDDLLKTTAGGRTAVATGAFNEANVDPAKYGDLPMSATWAAWAEADNIGLLEAGAKTYNDSQKLESFVRSMRDGNVVFMFDTDNPSDEECFVQGIYMRAAEKIVDLEDIGQTDAAQALRNALNRGALKFQKASEVPDLNVTGEVRHFADAGGGGTFGSTNFNPTGATKEAMDRGQAFAVGASDRGNFYVTW